MGENNFWKRKVFNTKEAAEYIGIISPRSLEKWRTGSTAKGPKWVNIEGNIGYRVCDLDEYLENCTRQPGDDFAA